MYGAIPFYQACCKYEVKPLIGLELLVEGEHEADSVSYDYSPKIIKATKIC